MTTHDDTKDCIHIFIEAIIIAKKSEGFFAKLILPLRLRT